MKARANGVGNRLKRLQRRCFWTSVDQRKKREKEQWKRFKLKKGREELKMSRRKLTQLEPCPLWSCPHPRGYRTKATLRGLDAFSNCYDEDNARPRRCISRASTQLSAMSRRYVLSNILAVQQYFRLIGTFFYIFIGAEHLFGGYVHHQYIFN